MLTSWIPYPTKLNGNTLDVVSLEENHFDELIQLGKIKTIWEHLPINGNEPGELLKQLQESLKGRENGQLYPFVYQHKVSGKLMGCTRFSEIDAKNQKLELGWTWLHPDYWGGNVNYECKLLILDFCFETLKTLRVQLKTDNRNQRSQRAMEKIGAQREGVLRNDRIRKDGTMRDSVYFSIIDTEWPFVKQLLLKRLGWDSDKDFAKTHLPADV